MPIFHHCLGCKEERQMKRVTLSLFRNGRPAIQGYCTKCGAKMTRMLPKFPPLEQGVVRAED